MTLGQRIQKGRKEAGLSQEELAEQLGVSRQAVSRWENDNGYPEMEKIIRLSQIYRMSLDYLVGNGQEKAEDISEKGWYVSNELAESFLAHQKSKFMKIGICFLLVCVSSAFSYMNMYHNIGDAISTFIIIVDIILIISMILSDNPYKKIWREPLVFDAEVLKRLRVTFAENKKKYRIMILGGSFVFLIGFLFLPDFYWAVPEDSQDIWYALGDAVQGIGGCFAIYTWGIWRAYRRLTMNEEYWRRKKKK
ncbi:MAG: helix-turn-helix transcriptional regulator [Clostridiales bacterium]|nr:helix-turn-helix transcriptional regulator [Clostridiales bacterium]